MQKIGTLLAAAACALSLTTANAEEDSSADEIARELANPNTPLATLRLKNQWTSYSGSLPGADSLDNFSMLFQPSFPFPIGDPGEVIFWRPAIPIFFDRPVWDPGSGSFDRQSGIGDIAMDLAYGKTSKNGILTAFGIVTTLPTANDDLGLDQWLLGPELLIGKLTETYVLGIFPNHQWDIAGEDDFDTSLTTIQVFATYLPGDGWAVASSPIMTYNWETSDWSIPLNLTVSKTAIFGETPYKLDFTLDYYVEAPDAFGPEWVIGFNIAPVVENVLASWFK